MIIIVVVIIIIMKIMKMIMMIYINKWEIINDNNKGFNNDCCKRNRFTNKLYE